MKMENIKYMNNKKDVFLVVYNGECYIIPLELKDRYDGTSYYDRKEEFSNYILPDGIILEEMSIDENDLKSIIEGDFY